MTIHIDAKQGEIADIILLPGDPLRAQYIAETFLQESYCYSTVRNMLGFTGVYHGKRISVQGTGMGIPSISIYVNELIQEFGVRKLLRIGSCGAISDALKLRDLVLAQAACTDSGVNISRFCGKSFAPTASFELLLNAHSLAQHRGFKTTVGSVVTSDLFYQEEGIDRWSLWKSYGVLAVEMETAELYTLAARFSVDALSLLTVSDSVNFKRALSPEERERTFEQMCRLALDAAVGLIG